MSQTSCLGHEGVDRLLHTPVYMIVHAKYVHVPLVMVIQTGVSILQSQCFVNSEQSFVFDNASVMVLPHYKYGSLLVSTCTQFTSQI